ncbi:helix-turn-helix domain-containing protein [Streptomyces tauricus]|uniref:helix-turn-helix domain-containing protein n=1 Tax=Streptomyces tauricus TaxID=68274 RepID=UPI0034420DC7
MEMSLAERVRITVAALMHATGQSQARLAGELGISQAQLSRRQAGSASWSLDDCDALAVHYGIEVLDLLAGPSRACEQLPHARRPARERQSANAPEGKR